MRKKMRFRVVTGVLRVLKSSVPINGSMIIFCLTARSSPEREKSTAGAGMTANVLVGLVPVALVGVARVAGAGSVPLGSYTGWPTEAQ